MYSPGSVVGQCQSPLKGDGDVLDVSEGFLCRRIDSECAEAEPSAEATSVNVDHSRPCTSSNSLVQDLPQPELLLASHDADDETPADQGDPGARRGATAAMEPSGIARPLGGTHGRSGRGNGGGQEDRPPPMDQRLEQEQPQEGQPQGVLRDQAQDDPNGERDHPRAPALRLEGDLQRLGAELPGSRGLREVVQLDVRAATQGTTLLREVGSRDHARGGEHLRLSPEPAGHVAHEPARRGARRDRDPGHRDAPEAQGGHHQGGDPGKAEGHHAEDQVIQTGKGLCQGWSQGMAQRCSCIFQRGDGGDHGPPQADHGDHEHDEAGDPAASRGKGVRGAPPEEDWGQRAKRDREELPDGDGPLSGSTSRTGGSSAIFEGTVDDGVAVEQQDWRQMSCAAAQVLESASWNNVPKLFSNLVLEQRPLLMEVCAEKEGVLTRAVQEAEGRESAAVQCCLWNSQDLGQQEGVQIVLEQMEALRPGVVWLSPPCEAYSPVQRTNQRSEAQKEELRTKRKKAIGMYVGCSVIWHYCVQHGIHVAWEFPEKSDAWRPPLVQDMIRRYSPHVTITKGCQVNARDGAGKLVQKGWKMMTTHQRLSELLHKPCKCHRNYEHGKGETIVGTGTMGYTREFGRLVVQAVQQELSFHGVRQESLGKSQAPDLFGGGSACMCHVTRQSMHVQTCACCVLEEREDREGESSLLTQDQEGTQGMEEQARRGLAGAKMSWKEMEEFLGKARFKAPKKGRGMMGGTAARPPYYQFGAYVHGPFTGLSRRTQEHTQLCRYVNQFLRKHAPADGTWTSFVISYNNAMPWHRDHHNLKGSYNYTCSMGQTSGGGMKVSGPGEANHEQEVDTYHKVVSFSPDAWHATCPWTGERIAISAYTVRSVHELSGEQRRELEKCGFPVPKQKRASHEQANLCCNPAEKREEAFVQAGSLSEAQRRRAAINKKLYLLHAATGHGSVRHLIEALKRRGASEEVIQAAKEFKCSVCHEKQRVQPRHLASLEPLPPKWYTVSADVGHWHHPATGEDIQFLLVLDENTRFRTARILSKGSKQQPSASTCLTYFQEGWVQYFGLPRTLRLDPAGAFRSQALETYCDKHSIFLDLAPAEAHWKIGSIEQAVQGTKELLQKIQADEPNITVEEALASAIRVFNHREQVRGFTPAQLAIGRNSDDTDRFVNEPHQLPPDLLVENASGEFARDVQRRATAEKAHADWHAAQRLMRAKHSRPRRLYDYVPGELVFFWRSQESNKHRRAPGGKHGRFLGPARVLATETRREDDGQLRPGSVVWCIRGKQLIKCCPEQLRRASERESLIEELSTDSRVPWTFTKVATEIGGNQFQDVSGEAPDEEEWGRAQDPQQAPPPVIRHRVRGKRAGPHEEEPGEGGEQQPARRPRQQENEQMALLAEKWQDRVAEDAWCDKPGEFWMQDNAAVQVELDIPDSARGRQQMCRNLECFFVGALKRKAVEVSERRLTPEEKQQFKEAKSVEVKNFIAAEAFKSLPPHLQASPQQAVGMRWILTWKNREDGSKKAKARAVLLGYQDPAYEHRSTTSPVMTRQTRQMFLQYASWKRWIIQKGDVSGAFLQGREYPDQLHCIPCPEILEAMNLAPGTVVQLKKACYGLVDAPLEWYRSVDEFLKSLGFERSWSDPCAWYLRKNGVLQGAISGHVDDFLFMGPEHDLEWNKILAAIKSKFKWGDWEQGVFTQCGVKVEASVEGYRLSQPGYTKEIKEIPLSSTRRKEDSSPITEWERTQLRMLLGGLSWHAQQVAPHLSAAVSLLLSETSQGTVGTVKKANQLLYHAQQRHDHQMVIHKHHPQDDLSVYAWVDAASQNRISGESTQGIFIGIAPSSLARGEVTEVTPISWHSSKIDRACRSPGAAEGQAATNGEDTLYYARYQWSEMLYGKVDVRDPDATVRRVPGHLITDSRNVYDKLNTEVLVIKGAEKRSNIELLSIKASQHSTHLDIRWVHSEAQLANGLTKMSTSREFELYYKMGGRWRIVEDPAMMSARRRKAQGLQPLHSESQGSVTREDSG